MFISEILYFLLVKELDFFEIQSVLPCLQKSMEGQIDVNIIKDKGDTMFS